MRILFWRKEKIKQYGSLNEAIGDFFGAGITYRLMEQVQGGDINDSYRLFLSNGEEVFIKMNRIQNVAFFQAEAACLWALSSVGKIAVPKPFFIGIDIEKKRSFLVMEFISSSLDQRDGWERLGYELADLHLSENRKFIGSEDQKKTYGFFMDTYIGSNPQKNTPKKSWISFYRDCRFIPQIKMAQRYFDLEVQKKFDRLLDHLDVYLREPPFPSLLHGDLWRGNVMFEKSGKAWIFDPASYVGDFEADIAMTQLFGGFPESFYSAYHEKNQIEKEFYDRRNLYFLYHLLNHLNLFGKSYFPEVISILKKYTG